MIKKTSILVILILMIGLFFNFTYLHSDTPDYYTGLGLEYNVKYYSYFIYDEIKDKYVFIDERPMVDLDNGTFYKVILEKDRDIKIVGAFYFMGKLKWALTYDNYGNIIRVEKYDENGELISDKHFDRNENLFFQIETGEFDIYQPRHNRKPEEDIQYVIAYITKGHGLEISDRRNIKKWYKGTIKKNVVRHQYYNIEKGVVYKESIFGLNNKHLYDRKFYYSKNLSKIEYAEYYTQEELTESAFYMYEGNNIKEIEYRGLDNDGIVREIYDNGVLKQTIAYYKYYLEEIIIDYEEGIPVSAIHNRYEPTLRLLKTHEYTIQDGKFITETVKGPLGNVYEEVSYQYNNDQLQTVTRNGVRKGNEYSLKVSYNYGKNNIVNGVSISGSLSGSLNYNHDMNNNILNINGSIGSNKMSYYTNTNGELNIDVLSKGSNTWEIYDDEEKVIASKKYVGDSVLTISNDGVITKYETMKDDKIQIIHFNNGKPRILETLSKEDRKPLNIEYFDESGKITKSVSFDPDNYSENFIEYDESGKIKSEYKLDAEGNLTAKLFYDDKERPYLYEEYNPYGVVIFYSIRTYDEDTGRLINYSSYKNFRDEGFRLNSVQIYGEGDLPEVIFIFDDISHLITTIQFNNKEGDKTKFIWRNITTINIEEEHRNYIKDTIKKISYSRTISREPSNSMLKNKEFYNKIK